jgi:ubiquinone/menaquinone biosynthesis C-methylase UbiE
MIRRFLQNTRKPEGFLGRMMLRGMNGGHTPMSNWGLSLVHPAPDARVLDIGCGGGANIARLMKLCPQGFVDGIDYSAESVAFSRKKNADLLGRRCDIRQGDAGELPYADETFDLVTAFETVYFWPDLGGAFREVLRVLKPGGQFLIVCEAGDPTNTTWTELIDGMTIYTGDDLKLRLETVGFASAALSRHEKGRIGLLACKRDRTKDS